MVLVGVLRYVEVSFEYEEFFYGSLELSFFVRELFDWGGFWVVERRL